MTYRSTTPLTDARIRELCTGHLTVRELISYHPRTHHVTTHYAAQVRGVLLKTRRGLRFATRHAALSAGRQCLARLKASIKPNKKG
jgi:hypothetical protein